MKRMKSLASLVSLWAVMLTLAFSLFVVSPSPCHAGIVAGTPDYSIIGGTRQRVVIPITCTAVAAAFGTLTINPTTYGIEGWYLWLVETDPGTTGPTNGAWDLDITSAHGFVESQALIDDRSSTLTQQVKGATLGSPQFLNSWTISIGDNAVNNAVVVVYLTFTANL